MEYLCSQYSTGLRIAEGGFLLASLANAHSAESHCSLRFTLVPTSRSQVGTSLLKEKYLVTDSTPVIQFATRSGIKESGKPDI